MATQSGNPQCPFCQLVANPEETFDVHETEHFKAWLDINPRAKGHTMIVPKEHLTSMDEIGEHVPEMFDMVRIVMEKAKNGLDADGVSVVLNEGEAGGQNLDHFYVQVFPRFEDEENSGAPAGAVFQPKEDIDQGDLEDISSQMEDAPFESGGNPRKDGAATDIVQSNRSRGRREGRQPGGSQAAAEHDRTVKREQVRNDTGEQSDSDSDNEDREDGEDEEEQENEDRWDGEDYSWSRDGAEFQ